MKSLETLFGSADINSFELQADFEQAVEACKNNIINKKADPALVNAKSVRFDFGGNSLPPSRFYSVLGSARIECFFSIAAAQKGLWSFSAARAQETAAEILLRFPLFFFLVLVR
ncbi:MAG: hypothetical protein L6V88_01245 [Anaerotruncus sp.]|nr:MAG: hypothetical protein L6V88_01245 [Anaerotruncus sp.]